MGKIHKLVFFERGVETLTYFSHELADAFRAWGYQIFFYDIEAKQQGFKHLCKFLKPGETAAVTFNFIGFSGESFLQEPDGRSVWESRDIPVYVILVDHPLYYYKQLEENYPNVTVLCIDRQHVSYMKRFYPKIPCYFLPLAGNIVRREGMDHAENLRVERETWIPYRERKYDVAFIANYVPLPPVEEHFTSQTPEYINFYQEILNGLRMRPDTPLDEAMEYYVKREIPEATDRELKAAFYGMLFLDLYNRTYFRERTVQMLVNHGITVHVFGNAWEKLPVKRPECLICSGKQLDSVGCVEVVRNAKLALNTMPWFKDGAHDRIFTAMLNGAVALTDPSIYLKERFTDEKDLRFYELKELTELPAIAEDALLYPGRMERLTNEAYERAVTQDTWECRARELAQLMEQ
ncbi:MAG: glycosyltransferase [Lachnospiraceae bacterium]|nr:glycosyltransferase [Lachnospiraceae bacterium]